MFPWTEQPLFLLLPFLALCLGTLGEPETLFGELKAQPSAQGARGCPGSLLLML